MNLFRRKVRLSPESEEKIIHAISLAEANTRAEIRVHLAHAVKREVYEDAKVTFHKLGLYKTELRSAILIYVVPNMHQFAIVGDIGIHEKVHDAFWQEVRDIMAQNFRDGEIADGIIKGIELAGEKLKEYFPSGGSNPNELSNEISRN